MALKPEAEVPSLKDEPTGRDSHALGFPDALTVLSSLFLVSPLRDPWVEGLVGLSLVSDQVARQYLDFGLYRGKNTD